MPGKQINDIPATNDFFEQVMAVTRMIPKGRVSTYGAIAAYLGAKRSARVVGWALNKAIAPRSEEAVPAHRVVNRNGLLSGKMHFATATQMEELLAAENITVIDDQVVEFDEHFWDPAEHLL